MKKDSIVEVVETDEFRDELENNMWKIFTEVSGTTHQLNTLRELLVHPEYVGVLTSRSNKTQIFTFSYFDGLQQLAIGQDFDGVAVYSRIPDPSLLIEMTFMKVYIPVQPLTQTLFKFSNRSTGYYKRSHMGASDGRFDLHPNPKTPKMDTILKDMYKSNLELFNEVPHADCQV